MKIQVDIPDSINTRLKVERIERGFANMQDLIVNILTEHYSRKGGKK